MQLTTTRVAAVIGTLMFGLTAAARAQAPGAAPAAHAHATPHGGDVTEVAGHHVEFKADSTGAITVWLLDERQRPVAPPSGATVTLMPAAGSQVIIPLQVDSAAQQLTARFDPRQYASFQAVVSLSITGTRQNVRFRYPSHH
jgi:hypothetical protein